MNKPKKILIFSNILISKNEIKGTGNWIITLLDELRKNKEFTYTIAFHDSLVKKIEFGNNTEFELIRIPLLYQSNKFNSTLSNWLILDKYKNTERDCLQIINN